MSLDALLSILFVVVFIVLPLVSRGMQARNRGRGARPDAHVPPGRQASTGSPPPWLVEAQRRVREAQASAEATGAPGERGQRPPDLVPEDAFGPLGGPQGRGSLVPEDRMPPLAPPARSGGLVPEDPFERGLVGPADAARAESTLGREGAIPTTMATGARDDDDAMVMLDMAPRRLRRGRPRAMPPGARLGPVGRVRLDRNAIVSGLIWHEILEEPAWQRRRGRRPSRLRSR